MVKPRKYVITIRPISRVGAPSRVFVFLVQKMTPDSAQNSSKAWKKLLNPSRVQRENIHRSEEGGRVPAM